MASAAQIQANRLNAQKSTGPRTPEGKAKTSQNAIKHGLFAREGVVRGEDPEEFEVHREMLLGQLNPAGPLEGILAARIVDLTWRLRRATQDQSEAFGALYEKYVARQGVVEAGSGPGTGLSVADVAPSNQGPEALATRGQGDPQRIISCWGPQDARGTDAADERGATLGRMILGDCSQDAVLERLLRYERWIEGSLYRTLNELRRVHDQNRKADQEVADTLGRWRQEDGQAGKARAFAPGPPQGVLHGPAHETRETNPISEVVSGWKCEASGKPCKTNPISPDLTEGQTVWGQGGQR